MVRDAGFTEICLFTSIERTLLVGRTARRDAGGTLGDWRLTLRSCVVLHVDGGRHGAADVVMRGNYCSRGSSMHVNAAQMVLAMILARVEPAVVMTRTLKLLRPRACADGLFRWI